MSAKSRGTAFICNSCLKGLRRTGTSYLQTSKKHQLSPIATFSTASTPPTTRHANRNTVPAWTSTPQRLPYHKQSPTRTYATNPSTSSPPTQPAPKGLAPVPSRRLISLSGPDAAKFLQGLVTNNVDPSRHSPFYSAFLDARGRVLWDVFIWTYPEIAGKEWACYIEVDAKEVEALGKHLRKHKLRSKIRIEVVAEGEIGVYAAWGDAREYLQHLSPIASLEDPRAPDFGTRYLFRGNQDLAGAAEALQMLEPSQYTLRRYIFGVAEGQEEIPREGALPMEYNVDLSDGIDFRKGCYVGQELTIRTKHTGVVRKRVLPIELYTTNPNPDSPSFPSVIFDSGFSASIPQAADIKILDENGSIKKGRAAGKFIAHVGNVGLALCRLEMMTGMRITAEGGTFREGMEFGVEADWGVVKVRPVVPQWFLERERALWDSGKGRSGGV